ncbi:extended synaptotagmin-3 [Betta splendens]|uniref:Extended synaptotagmin-3 n=1 Tax=Betta splendens TaxID=158456 RepID=A0A6P7LEQ6_BETSP|nr:extended synaptotagmin-3 [Betta splendens]
MATAEPVLPSGPTPGETLGETEPFDGSAEKLNSSAVNRMLMEFLVYVGRALLLFYPVYLTGYLGLSISWVLLCMLMVTWWQKNRQWKDTRIGTAIDLVDNETSVIDQELRSALQMASWVQFSEVEKVDWINKVLEQAWPFFGMYMDKLLRQKIQPTVRLSNAALRMFTFTKVHFGHVPLKITGMKVYTHEVDQKEVIMDMSICYNGDVDIQATVKPPITAGIKELKLTGMLRVILQPLIGQAPLVGGVTLFFIRRPTLQINWTGATNILDSPAFGTFSEETVINIVASLMVLPNRMCFPLIDQVKMDQMRFPLPRGVVRVYVVEAQNLVAKDTYMMGLVKGKSDPYAKVRVGDRTLKTKTIKQNLNPIWNEVYEYVVHEAPGQELDIELFDEDTDKDDFLGRFNLDLGEVKKEKEIDKWYPLEGIEKGNIHLKLQWLSLKSDSSLLKESDNGLACAMLAVYLDNASNLPKHSELTENQKHGKHVKEGRITKKNQNPNSFVELSVDSHIQKSKIVFASKDPVWEEGFTFFVHNVKTQQLIVQVKEPEKKTQLGVLVLPLNRLLGTSDMTLDQRFPLERSGANSQVKLKTALRILNVEKPQPKVTVSPPQQAKQQQQQQQAKPPPTQEKNGSVPTPSAAPPAAAGSSKPLSSSSASPSQAPPQASLPIRTPDSQDGSKGDPLSPRRGSLLSSETNRSSPSLANMRRFDSHSLLSDNSIASSRFDLSEGAMYPEAVRNHQGSFGEIHLTVRYANLRHKLIVQVIACRNLFPCSESGTDSYVRLYLLPDQTWRHRKRTSVKKKTVNPSFDDKFEFDVSLEEAQTRKLDVAVKNNKMFHRRERKDIGMVLLDLSQMNLTVGVTEWFELTLSGLKKSI